MTQSVDVVNKRVVRTGSNATFVASGTILDALTLQGALRIWRKKSGCAISAPTVSHCVIHPYPYDKTSYQRSAIASSTPTLRTKRLISGQLTTGYFLEGPMNESDRHSLTDSQDVNIGHSSLHACGFQPTITDQSDKAASLCNLWATTQQQRTLPSASNLHSVRLSLPSSLPPVLHQPTYSVQDAVGDVPQ
ncbi:hypothetical protein ACOMHN_048317 [Nucella lapillus]